MSFIYFMGQMRPDRINSKKDEKYHADFAKYCLSTMNNPTYRQFVDKCLINWSFFKGGDGQWIFDEDIEAFFLDESGDIRNRLKWTKNLIKPMVQQYVGNAIRLSYTAKASCISDFVINKREKDLRKLSAFQNVSEKLPFFKDIIKEYEPIQDTEFETKEMFMNTFVEDYEKDINNLIRFISQEININELKVQLARNLALSGLGIYKGYEACGNYCGETTIPLYFIWDLSAKKPDLTDSEYMGEWYLMDVPSIFERWQDLSRAEREAIERYGNSHAASGNTIHKMINNVFSNIGGKVPVYEMYWKDIEKREYGWVLDEYGYPYYTMINDPSSKYTDKNLIEPATDEHKKSMGKKKKHTIYVDIMRYCIFIPKEEVGTGEDDIVLEYGIAPYQEKELYDPANVKFPYKCYTWVYDRGEILTPLDDVIDPQRFLNRTLSVVESHLANMRGTGTVISKSAVDDRDGEAEINRNINASKPIFVDTDRVGSVQNAIGTYGTNIGGGTLQMFQVIQAVQQSMQDVTGVNEAMTGTQGGSDVLVGVIESQIQRGSLVQEPFYWALTSILKQAYQHMATVGKSVYYDNPRRLAIMVGDKGLQNITITEDDLLQDYRIFIDRAESDQQGVQNGNALLFTLLQAQLIDADMFSNLFNRATPDLIADAIRRNALDKRQAEYMAQKDNVNADTQALVQAGEAKQEMAAATETAKMEQMLLGEMDHQRKMDEIALKEGAKNEREAIKKQGI